MTDYTAKIRAKGLEATGVTEDLAKAMYNTPGKTTLAIVEMKHVRQIHDADGDRKVELVLTMVEPSITGDLDDHLRNLTRTMHQNRVLHSDEQALDITLSEDLEPTVDQVIAAGQHHTTETDDDLPSPDDGEPDGEAWEYPEAEATTEPTPAPANPFATSST